MARIFTNSVPFAQIAVKHFLSGEQTHQQLLPFLSQETEAAAYQRSLLEPPAEQDFIISICFSAMALEAFIYDYAARNLVDDPDAVSVTEIQGDQELTLELRVAPDDMGKVIGRQGRIAKEIRTVIRSYAQRTGVKVSVDIVD